VDVFALVDDPSRGFLPDGEDDLVPQIDAAVENELEVVPFLIEQVSRDLLKREGFIDDGNDLQENLLQVEQRSDCSRYVTVNVFRSAIFQANPRALFMGGGCCNSSSSLTIFSFRRSIVVTVFSPCPDTGSVPVSVTVLSAVLAEWELLWAVAAGPAVVAWRPSVPSADYR